MAGLLKIGKRTIDELIADGFPESIARYLVDNDVDPATLGPSQIAAVKNAKGYRPHFLSEGEALGNAESLGLDVQRYQSPDWEPDTTIPTYKLFNTDGNELYPLYINSDTPVEFGRWDRAKLGEQIRTGPESGKVASSIGNLAPRPGWHSGEAPMSGHIGGNRVNGKPTTRRPEQVWAEVLMPDDVPWQEEAIRRAPSTAKGKFGMANADIREQIPYGGNYRYKTNPNMVGDWLIGSDVKVNRVLSDEEVADINASRGLADLPREVKSKYLSPLLEKYGTPAGLLGGVALAGQSEDADAGVVSRSLKELIKQGYPESVAKRIADGTLDMSTEARMQRAGEQEYDVDTPLYHGTGADVLEFDPSKMGQTDDGWFGRGFYSSPDPNVANQYAAYGNPNVMKLFTKANKPYDWRTNDGHGMAHGNIEMRNNKTREILDGGFDSVDVTTDKVIAGDDGLTDELWQELVSGNPVLKSIGREKIEKSLSAGIPYGDFVKYYGEDLAKKMPKERTLTEKVVFDPSDIRSVNAAFDPEYTGANILGERSFIPAGLLSMIDNPNPSPEQRHQSIVDSGMRGLGIDENPLYERGTLLPYRQNIVTGENEMALPQVAVDVIRGLLDLGTTQKTGVYNPQSLFDAVL